MFIAFLLISIFFVGMAFGSFLNVIVYRTHTEESWWQGRSKCPNCEHELSWKELIPILSYLIQGGKCTNCKKKISIQYPLMEIVTGVILTFIFYKYGFELKSVLLSVIALLLLGNFVSDLKYMELPDIFSIPTIALSLLYQYLYHPFSWNSMIFGIFFGGMFFLIQYVLTQGRGIGAGDIRLGVIMGILLGWPLVLYSIMIAYVAGSIIALSLLALKKMSMKSAMPLGVFLIPSLVLVFIYSNEISSYLSSMISFSL